MSAKELPETVEHMLCAMAVNYEPGRHTWDKLDTEVVIKAAAEISALRAAIAAYRARGEGEMCPGCGGIAQRVFAGPYLVMLRCTACGMDYAGHEQCEYNKHGAAFATSPTAPDASQAEQAAMYRELRRDFSPMGVNIDGQHAWVYRRNATLKGPTLDDALRTAMTKETRNAPV
ncbi:MAG: hypothetical protein V4757_07435 [Pseudomonadota bacterium]